MSFLISSSHTAHFIAVIEYFNHYHCVLIHCRRVHTVLQVVVYVNTENELCVFLVTLSFISFHSRSPWGDLKSSSIFSCSDFCLATSLTSFVPFSLHHRMCHPMTSSPTGHSHPEQGMSLRELTLYEIACRVNDSTSKMGRALLHKFLASRAWYVSTGTYLIRDSVPDKWLHKKNGTCTIA